MEIRRNKYGKYQCPCCGYYTFDEKVDNSLQDCPVCWWENDGIQLHDADYVGGANQISLNEARENFKKYKAMDEELENYVRAPAKDELPD